MKKTVLVALLVAMLVMALAVPAFASPPVVPQACAALLAASSSAIQRGDSQLGAHLLSIAPTVCPI